MRDQIENEIDVSVVVVAYNMERELPRTLQSLSPRMQRDVDGISYEVIVVDNGSRVPVAASVLEDAGLNGKVIRVRGATPSPCRAVNDGLRRARGTLCGVLIDGARICSPGLVRCALLASRTSSRAVVATLGFHLGPAAQNVSIHQGYNQVVEDQLLESVRWTEDGYRLFSISALAGSSAGGWFRPIVESNGLFMNLEMWNELGGYNESFVLPGGGLANLDLYKRACEADSDLVMLLGEGTFHQFHGGVATNATVSPWEDFEAEYVRIRGSRYGAASVRTRYFGEMIKPASPFLLRSIEQL